MGTSKSYCGPSTGLVPSWVDDPAPTGAPGTPLSPTQPGIPGSPLNPPGQPPARPQTQPSPDTSGAGSLGGARGNFTRFSRTGSRSSLGRALSDYVRNGTGGPQRAARRMGVSRAVGAGLLGVVRDLQQIGPAETLRKLNLAGLAGRPATEVFVAIIDVVCPPGGAVDEAIARQAMLETIGDMAEAGITGFDTLTPELLREFFLDFIARSIEGRIMADIGGRGITLPDDVAAVEYAQLQLHDFITGCTRGALSSRLDGVEHLADQEIQDVVNQIYEVAFDLVAAAGEAAA